jgi:hypothetical protein
MELDRFKQGICRTYFKTGIAPIVAREIALALANYPMLFEAIAFRYPPAPML